MELNKRKRVFYNLIVGILGKILLMILGFVVPKLYIENYGSEVNGLLSSIAQVFSYLALFEAGVGVAATQALYEPVAHNDVARINGIMAATSRFYKRSGLLYGFCVLVFAIVYPLVMESDVKNSTVFLLIVLSGANGVLNYLFQAKYFSLLNAEGKRYVHVAIGTGISIITTLSKIVLLALKLDIVFVYVVYFVLALLQNLANYIYVRRNYRYLNFQVRPDKESLKQSSSVLIHQVSSLIFSHTDVLLLTFFCNLKVVSIYTIYNMVTESLGAVMDIVFNSFTAALGLTYQQNKDSFRRQYDLFELGTWMLSFGVMVVTLLLYNPFIALYTSKADILYVDQWLPLLFVLCKLMSLIRMPCVNAVNVAGHFKVTQTHTIIESCINIVASLICVQFFGIYGVLFGTFAALFYRTIHFLVHTNQFIVYRRPSHIIKRLLINVFFSVAFYLAADALMPEIKTVPDFLLVGSVLTVAVFAMLILVNFLREKNCESVDLLKILMRKWLSKSEKSK